MTRSSCVALLVPLLLCGCAAAPSRHCAPGEHRMVSEMLYFGTQMPDGTVTPQQWTQFLATQVTPRLPRGLTVWPAAGQWQGVDGSITRENSYALSLLHPDDAANEAAIRAIAAEYKSRFQQEAVLRVRSDVCASF